jgi:hypothetical protein
VLANPGTAAATHSAINITTGAGYTITGNFIGGNAANATGTMNYSGAGLIRIFGISATFTGGTSEVQGNIIRNITSATGTTGNPNFAGISIGGAGNANIGTVTGNTIGSATGNGSITITGAAAASAFGMLLSTTGTLNVQNNVIASYTVNAINTATAVGFTGIQSQGATTTPVTMSNNTIGSPTVVNSINCTNEATTGAQNLHGFVMQSNAGAATFNGNTIANCRNLGTTATSNVRGIYYIGSAPGTYTNNVIHNLTGKNSNPAATGGLMGIINWPQAAFRNATITDNIIHSLHAINTDPVQTQAIGIFSTNMDNVSI